MSCGRIAEEDESAWLKQYFLLWKTIMIHRKTIDLLCIEHGHLFMRRNGLG